MNLYTLKHHTCISSILHQITTCAFLLFAVSSDTHYVRAPIYTVSGRHIEQSYSCSSANSLLHNIVITLCVPHMWCVRSISYTISSIPIAFS